MTWNIAHRPECWECLDEVDGVDVALLQEASPPPAGCDCEVLPQTSDAWRTAGWERRGWRTAIVNVSRRYELREHPVLEPPQFDAAALTVSRPGTLTVADVLRGGELLFSAASMYGAWERPLDGSIIYADAMVHRLLSDLSQLVTTQTRHRVLAAGDLNVLHGYGEDGSPYWARRYLSIFDRADALGIPFVGPQAPEGGRVADPPAAELPADSRDVPTYYSRSQSPETATRQLDFVFASPSLGTVTTRALNGADEWGPSDHCRVVIDIDI